LKHQTRSETSSSHEPWQNGTAQRMLQTLSSTARTVLLSSGSDGCFWFLAMQYATRMHNIQYHATTDSSPFVLMHDTKPNMSGDRILGVDAWLFVHPE